MSQNLDDFADRRKYTLYLTKIGNFKPFYSGLHFGFVPAVCADHAEALEFGSSIMSI